MQIGANIRDLRISKKMSKSELAPKMYTSVEEIDSWEDGKKEPTDKDIQAIAKVIGVDKEQITGIDTKCHWCNNPITDTNSFVKTKYTSFAKDFLNGNGVYNPLLTKKAKRIPFFGEEQIVCKQCYEEFEIKRDNYLKSVMRDRLARRKKALKLHFLVGFSLLFAFVTAGILVQVFTKFLALAIILYVSGVDFFALTGVFFLKNNWLYRELGGKKEPSPSSVEDFLDGFVYGADADALIFWPAAIFIFVVALVVYPSTIKNYIKYQKLDKLELEKIDARLNK